jgi:hypothetical protein
MGQARVGTDGTSRTPVLLIGSHPSPATPARDPSLRDVTMNVHGSFILEVAARGQRRDPTTRDTRV